MPSVLLSASDDQHQWIHCAGRAPPAQLVEKAYRNSHVDVQRDGGVAMRVGKIRNAGEVKNGVIGAGVEQ